MISLIIINSLIIWGVYASIQEGFIFEKIGNFFKSGRTLFNDHGAISGYKHNIPKWIQKPLATCPVCMSSVYGTPVFWFAYLIDVINYDYIIFVYICYIFALAGLNYLILVFMPE